MRAPLKKQLGEGKMYKCGSCGRMVELKADEPTRCPFCGYKILFKERSKVVKRVKAR